MYMFQKIIKGEYYFDDDPWPHVSDRAKQLIQGLLTVDPARRWTVQDAVMSPFMQAYSSVISGERAGSI